MKHIVATLLALGSAVLLTEAAPRTKTLELQEVLRVASTIDQLLEKDLKARKLQPLPIIAEDVFVRRTYLNIVGRIPTALEASTLGPGSPPGALRCSSSSSWFPAALPQRVDLCVRGRAVLCVIGTSPRVRSPSLCDMLASMCVMAPTLCVTGPTLCAMRPRPCIMCKDDDENRT